MKYNIIQLLSIPNLLCMWDFADPSPLVAKGKFPYVLLPAGKLGDEEAITKEGTLNIAEGAYYYIPRADCQALNIHGKNAEVTVMAWVKRSSKSFVQCEAIAGMWNETEKKRQYCLFLNLRLFDSADQVCGHISGVGGATPNQQWCVDAAIGQHKVEFEEWTFVAFTYDGKTIKSYLNGEFDARAERNPYPYQEGIFDGGADGSDFTVGAVHRLGEMGNDFVGEIACLAVFDRALTEQELLECYLTTN